MMDEKDRDRIERLLRGELSAEEASSLRADAAASEDLTQELEFAQDLDKVVGVAGRMSLKSRLQQLQQLEQSGENKAPLRVNWRRPLAIAASVLLLLGVATVWYANTAYSDEALLAAHYELPNFSGARSATNPSAWEQVTAAFYSQNYVGVEQLMAENPELKATEDGMLLLAHTYLQSNQITAALLQIALLAEGPTKDWLQVQALLAAGEYAALERSLAEITASPEHPYYQEAMELKQKVNSGWRLLQ